MNRPSEKSAAVIFSADRVDYPIGGNRFIDTGGTRANFIVETQIVFGLQTKLETKQVSVVFKNVLFSHLSLWDFSQKKESIKRRERSRGEI